MGTQGLEDLSRLVANVLLPIYLFYATATTVTRGSLKAAPLLIVTGVVVALLNFALATGGIWLFRVNCAQRPAFRFSALVANTSFFGFPICAMLFGSVGVVYAVMYDFGLTLVVLTLGIWDLSGRERTNIRAVVLNPLSWGVLLGLGWGLLEQGFPQWITQPLSTLGNATLPMALLVGGAYLGSIPTREPRKTRQLSGLVFTRLVLSPLAVGALVTLMGWTGAPAGIIVLQSAMPVGITTTLYASAYGADAEFTATATLWSTTAAVVSLPCVTLLLR